LELVGYQTEPIKFHMIIFVPDLVAVLW